MKRDLVQVADAAIAAIRERTAITLRDLDDLERMARGMERPMLLISGDVIELIEAGEKP